MAESTLIMQPKKRIFIIGHSGAGKALLAQALADSLGWKFMNADFGLAPTIGRDLSEILGKEGEEAFSQCLTEILGEQLKKESIVVATDDSIVCSEKNRQLLSSEFTVYLKVSIDIQLERISYNRPLLASTNYKAFLEKLREERDAFYKQVSSFSLSSDKGSIEEHVASIIKALDA
jgi:shikimate kinase